MRRRDALRAGLLLGLALPALAEEAALRYSAPIVVQDHAAFVQLPLPASTYGHSLQSGLADLRIVDSRAQRVPFALLTPRQRERREVEQPRSAALYPLPRRPAAGTEWPSPVEVLVQGGRISVRRLGDTAAATATAPPGWLIDLGERSPDDPPAQSLRLSWSGPAEFSAGFDFQMSDDLRTWRPGGSGQLMALTTANGSLTQPRLMLPAGALRFIRLVWLDPAVAPVLDGARMVSAELASAAPDPPSELLFSASPEPEGRRAMDEAAKRALHFDLGGPLPLVRMDLELVPGTQVAPVRVQGRSDVDERWRDLTQAVVYRLERGDQVSRSPPIELQATSRYLRIVPDERSATLDAGTTRLRVHAQLARLVFATQGQAPYTLLAGSRDAQPGALPVATLVPGLDDERTRFGHASLGPWSEVAQAARQAEAELRRAALRPWLLWGVLLGGVAGLGLMVWRLVRRKQDTPT